ncbi:NrtR DNA-binding winged helix domain-containing protein [Runella sp. SP2]|uniref:NUDIX hydrolase n=1 Tax=Runella sp. SP2 TaxID=2268026 RepID=UPI000F08DABA|nr:NUDIX domain-containing protein [Runella sp. SP2]AYQ31817.1 NUDIX domain-containing protein [Runella sp. SP2]
MKSLSQQNYIPQVSIDCVIFGYSEQQLQVLIPKINFKGDFWALPSGFVFQDEDMDNAAQRILRERTGIESIYLEQFKVFGRANRSSKAFLDKLIQQNFDKLGEKSASHATEYDWFTKRFLSVGYYALVDMNKVVPQKTDLDESIEWYGIHDLPQMIMDHEEIINEALKTLQSHIDEKINAFNLLPDTFTMKEVQDVYEAISGKSFVRTNFQKMILSLDVLERLEKKFTGAANKAPYLYRFRKD